MSHIANEGQGCYTKTKGEKDMGSYIHAIDPLKGILITLGTSIGAVMLVYGDIKFAMAFRQMNQQGEHQDMLVMEPWYLP